MNISFFLSLGHLQLPNNKPACTQNRHKLGPLALVAISEVKNVAGNFHRKYKHKEQGSSDQATNKQAEATDQPTNYVKTFGEACLWLLARFWGTTLLYFTISNFQFPTALIQLMDQILFDLNIDKVLGLSLLITKRHLMSATITCYSQSLSW